MTQPSRLLSQEAYEATLSPPMRDVAGSAEEIVDLWGYADPVIEDLRHNCGAGHSPAPPRRRAPPGPGPDSDHRGAANDFTTRSIHLHQTHRS